MQSGEIARQEKNARIKPFCSMRRHGAITPARKFRMLLHINPTRQRGKRTGSLARASGWYMTFFAAGVIRTPIIAEA
jgi:hypothetical protein